ncbi:GIY-YIG nuclease family protein [Sphingomonas sp. H39-1-10]|uniref:GIY-YIG nuclease family protein n=1 Tax=Sphingomonas pollutisoli TaxID=3030829 RepID=UPI0023B88E79|nr:GIY-YIG nuclease family protein [Sphingomonas pollutisoli]MDF0489375.1 GIY-YIG nuclease family protein [Sphingomonas pollutisoli]
MAFWAYLLRCADGSFYAGHTDALEARIGVHEAGRGSDYTARRRPVTLVWSQDFPSRIEALEAERQIKGWSRAKKEALIAGDWTRVSQLAASRGTRASTSSARTEFDRERSDKPD